MFIEHVWGTSYAVGLLMTFNCCFNISPPFSLNVIVWITEPPFVTLPFQELLLKAILVLVISIQHSYFWWNRSNKRMEYILKMEI